MSERELLATRFVRLKNGAGEVRIDFDLDWSNLPDDEKKFVLSIMALIQKYDGYCFPPVIGGNDGQG